MVNVSAFLSYAAANKIKVGYSSLNCKMSQLLCISWGTWCLLVNVFIFVILTKILVSKDVFT